jgi:hypothetical protein
MNKEKVVNENKIVIKIRIERERVFKNENKRIMVDEMRMIVRIK